MGIAAVYTGLVPVVYKAQREMLNGLAWNFVTDLLTIASVMIVVFWDLSAGLILLLPSVFPMVIVFGIMGWMGIVIDVGTIMTPTVALGVSVDDVVHFLIWYRRGLAEGKNRKEAVMLAYEGCARAMYQSWAVLGLGLFVFALSSFVPTQRFGALMFTLLTAALLGNLIMLPCVLASPLAYFFGRRLVRKAHAEHRDRVAAGDAPVSGHLSPINGDAPADSTRDKFATTARTASAPEKRGRESFFDSGGPVRVHCPACRDAARAIVGGYVYHVLNRANGRLRLFKKDADFAAFESIIAEAHERVPLRVLGYVVMSNHWHFVVWPKQRQHEQVSEFFRWLTVTHAQALARPPRHFRHGPCLSRSIQVVPRGLRRTLAERAAIRGAQSSASRPGRPRGSLAVGQFVSPRTRHE